MGFKEDNEAGLKDKERLEALSASFKDEAKRQLAEHNDNAPNGPEEEKKSTKKK